MLEDQVAFLLQKYLGNYVLGLNKDALKISAWRGDVELSNMQLKPEALNALKLPVKVKAGFLGSVKLKVPWSRLGQEPVLVHFDRIFVLAEPATQDEGFNEDSVQEAKKARVREMEIKLVESSQKLTTEMNRSWLGSLINTVIGNLKLSITNIHIRYEDTESHPGHPFAAGIILSKLKAFTIDDVGKETFATGGALENIQKSVELDRLAVYLDSDVCPWNVVKLWKDMLPSEWSMVFEIGSEDGKLVGKSTARHSYILHPVSGDAKYTKVPADGTRNIGEPVLKAAINLDDVTLCLSKEGYNDLLQLAENFAAFNQRLKYACYRPHVSVKSNARLWWKYAYKVISDVMKKASGKLAWEQVLKYARLRKKYISLYISLLKSDPSRLVIDDNKEIDNLDRELDIDVIILWRMLAHKFVQQSSEYEVYQKKRSAGKSWWSLAWSGNSDAIEDEPGPLSEEDWNQLNEIIGYKKGVDEQMFSQDEGLLHMYLTINMKHNASRLTERHLSLAELSCDNLECAVKLYPETKIFDLRLGSYRLSSPKGTLAESATSHNSFVGLFAYKPFDSEVDWSLVAKASPCYMTYLNDSINQIIHFFRSSNAVNRTMVLETAAALQVTIDGVKRSAQQQVSRVLKNQTRFLLNLDIAAPKVTIPTDFSPDKSNTTKLLIDLGNLVLHTQDDSSGDTHEERELYLQFNVALTDVSAFLVDGDYNWSDHCPKVPAKSLGGSNMNLLPVIDNCGIVLKLQQIRVEHPPFPSMRVAIRIPTLGFHFSPARYHRLMQVVNIFQKEDTVDLPRPWFESDFEGWLSLLSWKGVGNREAVWQNRYICLVGTFLYVLDNPDAKTYKRSISLRGKQLYQIPSECVGNVEHVLAIGDPGLSNVKIIESNNAIILRFETEDLLKAWLGRLQSAIYRASHSAGFTNLEEITSDTEDAASAAMDRAWSSTAVMEKMFITGSLDELKICFSCNPYNNQLFEKIMSTKESPLLEFRAMGGQVEVSSRPNDLLIGTLLKSLEVEDLYDFYEGMPSPRYLAQSFYENSALSGSGTSLMSRYTRSRSYGSNDTIQFDGEEKFYEASSEFSDFNDSTMLPQDMNNLSLDKKSVCPPSFDRIPGLLPDADLRQRSQNVQMNDTLDGFVKAQIIFYDPESPHYNKIDKQVVVTLATLSFFCYRPTILALLDFLNAVNLNDDSAHDQKGNSLNDDVDSETVRRGLISSPNSGTVNEPVVKGLLGKGKSRVIFYLSLNMYQAQVFLLMEDGKQLATMLQNNLLADIKVFPSSFGIKAAVGNLKISDDSLPRSHSYFWICDMRNPRGSSFVELEFSSYVAGDEDYSGFEYSLFGNLSEVRIVYLNRFVQEIVSYFTGLVPTGSRSVVILKDQMTNSEKWFSRADIEGSPAVKLDLTLTKPIIIMPRRTDSLDYLELDVVHITVQNTFKWLLGDKNDFNAVRLDIMSLQIEDINLTIGVGSGSCGSIIQDVKGLSVVIRRALRDLLHQIPAIEIAIEMEELKAALSNKEYQIITECALSNISETPRKIPSLENICTTAATDALEHSKPSDMDVPTQVSLSTEAWITMEVSVSIHLVQLCLHSGSMRDSALATMQVTAAWLHYNSTSLDEGYLLSTFKDFSVMDDREGTKPEHRLAIGRPDDSEYLSLGRIFEYHNGHRDVVSGNNMGSILTMLVLDVKFSPSSTQVSVYIQRPQLLVALDFLLAIVEFFVPNIRGMMNTEESDNLLRLAGAVAIDKPVFAQPCPEFSISPMRPLVADHERYDHLVYDGKGGRLYLQNRQGVNLTSPSKEPVIYVGNGKTLQFKNVFIMSGEYLDSCILLGVNSSYTVSEDDLVYLEIVNEVSSPHIKENIDRSVPQNPVEESTKEFTLELQAIGPELTFYDTSINIGESAILSSKLLHAQLDIFAKLVLKGESVEMSASTLGLMMESNGIPILEPLDTMMEFSNASGKTSIRLVTSDILMNYSFSLLKLFLAVEEDILAFLRMTSKKPTIECTQFDNVGTIQNSQTKQIYAIWRPRAPHGFAVLGDCITPTNDPPTKGVLAVNTSFVRVKRPLSFKPIWPFPLAGYTGQDSSQDIEEPVPSGDAGEGSSCSVWLPVAPPGYVALGCVASVGDGSPPLSSALCILASYVAPCAFKDCIAIISSESCSSLAAFWRVDNSFGSFLPSEPGTMSITRGGAYELRHIIFGYLEEAVKAEAAAISRDLDLRTSRPVRYAASTSSRQIEPTSTFKLVWWDHGCTSDKKISIWRPIVSDGMVYLGDIVVSGYEPPCSSAVLEDNGDGTILKPPIDFQLVGKIKKQRGVESIAFWLPQAPPGFVSLGCIASKGNPKSSEFDAFRCIRNDMVTGDKFPDECLWDTSSAHLTADTFSIWTVGGESGTFIVRSGLRKPPKRLALKLLKSDLSCWTDSIIINTEITTFSAAFYDDFVGLMVPLCNVSLNDIGINLHGRPDCLTTNVNFSLAARSYNDRYNSWEPLIEPINGFLRYHPCLNASTSAPQLRITSAQDLNLNISVSNINMILQAYSSWTNLCNVESFKKREFSLPTHNGKSVIDSHHHRNFSIVPQNRLGQEIFVRAVESRGLSDIIGLPSGDTKLVKVPVLRNMVDAHPRGSSRKVSWVLMTVFVCDAELPRFEGLDCHCYTMTICLCPTEDAPRRLLPKKQSARTCGVLSKPLASGMDLVIWHETFFFRVDSLENIVMEFKVTDVRKGEVVGHHSSLLKDVACDIGSRPTSDELSWITLPLENGTMLKERNSKTLFPKLRCAVLQMATPEEDVMNTNVSGSNSGFIQISPSRNGPWTTVRLNYAAPAACWRLGDVLVASEVSLNEGNIYVNIRSLASVSNHTDFVIDVSLNSRNYKLKLSSPEANKETEGEYLEGKLTGTDDMSSTNHVRRKRWIQSGKHAPDCATSLLVGRLNPGETVPLPLASLTSSECCCIFQMRPTEDNASMEYSWSSVLDVTKSTEVSAVPNEPFEIDVSDLKECQKLLFCRKECGSSSDDFQEVWFFLSLRATEIGRDVNSDPIEDWNLSVDSPLSITNFLPHSSEYSIFEQSDQQLIPRSQGILQSGETARIYNADPRSPLYISLLPQGGWQPINEAVLISHPSGNISKTISFKSPSSGRSLQVFLEQSQGKEQLAPKVISVYAPYWIVCDRCPSLKYRLTDLSGRKRSKSFSLPFHSSRAKQKIVGHIVEEEMSGGCTVASGLNFDQLGLSVSIAHQGEEEFGPVKDISPLKDMDGSVDLYAYDGDADCLRLFISSKPCPYQSVPSKIISIRPYMTFTNRIGQDIYIKLHDEDQPKSLPAFDSRVSFTYSRKAQECEKLQVRLEDTEWCFPVGLVKEDTLTTVLRNKNGGLTILRIEIRGYEEGSRFIVVFRLGSCNGPIKIENRTKKTEIGIRQSGLSDDAWSQLIPLSTMAYAWEDPYGQRAIDIRISYGNGFSVERLSLDKPFTSPLTEIFQNIQLRITEVRDVKIVRFTDSGEGQKLAPHDEGKTMVAVSNGGTSAMQNSVQNNAVPLEVIVEVGVVAVSLIDHRPRELLYLYVERVFISYITGSDEMAASRLKIILGYLQLDNQLPLALMPVLLVPESIDTKHPVFKMTISMNNSSTDGTLVYPFVYARVTEKPWRFNIHEPIIWALLNFYNNLQIDKIPSSSSGTAVDPEIRIDLVDVSEMRLKLSLEPDPSQRPHGVLGVWSPILSVIGNALKIQIHLRKVTRRNRFMRKSSVVPAIGNRILRDLIHNPLHLIFAFDVLGMTSSTLASLSKGFAELSTDVQFLELRSKQVWSRRITGVSDGILQGTEALAQGLAFGVSGVLRKPVESAKEHGILGLAYGFGQAFVGFVTQPVSGALDFFSMTVDGVGASCSRCLEIFTNRPIYQRIRNPRAIHVSGVLKEYCEREATGQTILYLAEASRQFGCTEIFREPSKYAWSDYYEDHFILIQQKILLLTNKRAMLLQCLAFDKLDKRPCKIMWDIPWEELMALELAKAGHSKPSILFLHVKNFHRSESYVHMVKCSDEEEDGEPLAIKICSVVRKSWKQYQASNKTVTVKVPASQRHVQLAWDECGEGSFRSRVHPPIKPGEILASESSSGVKFVERTVNFVKIWSSEQETKGKCSLCPKQADNNAGLCSIWRPICPEGYISVGDIAHVSAHFPSVAAVYQNMRGRFALPIGYDLVWRNCLDDYVTPVSIWLPRAPEGYVSLGCVAVAGFKEPEEDSAYCVVSSFGEEATFEEQMVWTAADSYPWACYIHQVQSEALHFVALRQPKEVSDWKPMRVSSNSLMQFTEDSRS